MPLSLIDVARSQPTPVPIGQIAFATARTPIVRALIGLLYAVPASTAGYHLTLGLSQIGMPSEAWREIFAIVGAALVGGTAWARLTLFAPPYTERRVARGPGNSPLAVATKDR